MLQRAQNVVARNATTVFRRAFTSKTEASIALENKYVPRIHPHAASANARSPHLTFTFCFSRSLPTRTLFLLFRHAAHNYHPLPVVFSQAQGVNVTDVDGKKYIDFLSAYSAVNQGHCHPRIIKAMVDQASTVALSSRAFHNDKFPGKLI
jgi:hypothetical protein